MLAVLACWIVFIHHAYKNKLFGEFFLFFKSKDKKTSYAVLFFFVSAIFGLFVNGYSIEKLGQGLVIYTLPISVFFLCGFIFKKHPQSKDLLVNASYFLVGLAGLFALLQYFTLFGLEPAYWGNEVEPKRASSLFNHPNFYGLFIAPILSFLIPFTLEGLKKLNSEDRYLRLIAWLLGGCGILVSFSRSSWLGVAAAFGFYVVFSAGKKTRTAIFLVSLLAVIGASFVPAVKIRVLSPFKGEKSANSRLTLWESGIKGIKESPILGLGLKGYSQEYKTLISDPALPAHNYPHNIFLSLWNENGIIGLISFLVIIYSILIKWAQNKTNKFYVAVVLSVVCILIQGLVDNPYFKNDLAVVFWVLASLII